MTNNTNKSMDQIVSEIDVKMDELFDLFWERTLKGIDNQIEYLRSVNCPQFIVDNHIIDKPILMKKRYEEIEDPLKVEFKNRFLNEQWMDMDDCVPIIPTELSMYDRNDDLIGFIISNFDVERNRRSFIKDFYIDQCGYTQIKTNLELFVYWFKWNVVYSLKYNFVDRPIRTVRSSITKLFKFNKTETV